MLLGSVPPATADLVDAADQPIAQAVESLPIFDAHIHYKEPAWAPFPPGTVIELMNESDVAMGL